MPTRSSVLSPDMRVRRIHRQEDLLQLEEAWTQLLLDSGYATLFSSYQWNVAWWRHFGYDRATRRTGAAALHVLTVWSDGGRLVGLAPFMVRRLGPLRKLEFLCTGLADYGD